MTGELLLTRCRLPGGNLADLLLEGGVITAVASPGEIAHTGPVVDATGRLVTPGLTDPHLHPDKAFDLTGVDDAGDVNDAIRHVRERKPAQTVEAIRDRTLRLLRWCSSLGTTRVRLHAEVDPLLGLRSVQGVLEARAAFAGRIRAEVVAFPQEGIVREPGTLQLMREAMVMGCDAVGAITYQDPDACEHLSLAAQLACDFDSPLDVHADFCVSPEQSALSAVVQTTRRYGLEGRVTLGHCTTLARMAPDMRSAVVEELVAAGISLVVLPRTDLYLDGAIAPLGELRAAGMRCFIASNNVCNAFTPAGRPSLPSVAALYALANREASQGQLAQLATSLWQAGAVCGVEARIERGAAADLAVWPVASPWQMVAAEPVPDIVLVGGRVVDRAQEREEADARRPDGAVAATTRNQE